MRPSAAPHPEYEAETEHSLKGREQVFDDQRGPSLGLGNSCKSSRTVSALRCGVSCGGLCGAFPVLMDNVDTVNVQEGTSVDVPKPDLVDEPFDRGLPHGSRIEQPTFWEMLVHSQLAEPADFRISVTI